MKKLFIFMLTLISFFTLVGCGRDKNKKTNKKENPTNINQNDKKFDVKDNFIIFLDEELEISYNNPQKTELKLELENKDVLEIINHDNELETIKVKPLKIGNTYIFIKDSEKDLEIAKTEIRIVENTKTPRLEKLEKLVNDIKELEKNLNLILENKDYKEITSAVKVMGFKSKQKNEEKQKASEELKELLQSPAGVNIVISHIGKQFWDTASAQLVLKGTKEEQDKNKKEITEIADSFKQTNEDLFQSLLPALFSLGLKKDEIAEYFKEAKEAINYFQKLKDDKNELSNLIQKINKHIDLTKELSTEDYVSKEKELIEIETKFEEEFATIKNNIKQKITFMNDNSVPFYNFFTEIYNTKTIATYAGIGNTDKTNDNTTETDKLLQNIEKFLTIMPKYVLKVVESSEDVSKQPSETASILKFYTILVKLMYNKQSDGTYVTDDGLNRVISILKEIDRETVRDVLFNLYENIRKEKIQTDNLPDPLKEHKDFKNKSEKEVFVFISKYLRLCSDLRQLIK